MKETFFVVLAVIGFILFITLLSFGTGALNLLWQGYAQPKQIEITRQSNQQSQQYVETEQQLMLGLVQDLRRLDAQPESDAKEAQKKATLDRLEQEAQKIPADQVPAPVRTVLGANGRYL